MSISGGVDRAEVSYIIRDHDKAIFEKRLGYMNEVVDKMNAVYGEGTVAVEVKRQYANMREKIEPLMHIIDIAKEAMCEVGVTPEVKPIRGGTDGAQLSFMGLPCPNMFAGGINFHSRYEFVSLQVMEKAMMTIVKIVEGVARRTE